MCKYFTHATNCISAWRRVFLYENLKIHLTGRVSHPSAYCVVIAPYISSPYYTDGTITAGPIAAASRGHTGPICGMKHQWQFHLCVFLIHPSLHPSSPKPLPFFHSLPRLSLFLSSATRQIKSLSIMTQMREAHL